MSELTVGREMDAAVAKALGCDPLFYDYEHCQCEDMRHALACDLLNSGKCDHAPVDELRYYSTRDADAFAALDAVMAKHPYWTWRLLCDTFYKDGPMPTRLYCLRIEDELHSIRADSMMYCPTRAEAVCRAILALAEATT